MVCFFFFFFPSKIWHFFQIFWRCEEYDDIGNAFLKDSSRGNKSPKAAFLCEGTGKKVNKRNPNPYKHFLFVRMRRFSRQLQNPHWIVVFHVQTVPWNVRWSLIAQTFHKTRSTDSWNSVGFICFIQVDMNEGGKKFVFIYADGGTWDHTYKRSQDLV